MTKGQRDRKRHPERYCPACKRHLDTMVRYVDGERVETRSCGWADCPWNGRPQGDASTTLVQRVGGRG